MNKHVILLSAAAVLLFSCSREPEQVIQPGETITFTARWASSEDTRTILQEDGTSVWWEPGAQINVFFSDKASGKFTSTNSQAQAIVDFQGSLPIVVGSVETENPPHAYWAVYPYDAANTCDGESVTLTIPSTQTAIEGTFANKMFPSIATSTNFYLAFYNVCGGVRFTVANEGIASVTFKANNGESLTGKVKVGFDSVPIVKSVVEGTSEVVVNAPTGGFVPGKYYFAALLPQTLSKGVSLTFKKEDGKVASTSLDNSITINRSRFGKMDEKDKGLDFKDDGGGVDPADAIVFADKKVKEKLVARFDTNGDGELSYEEAAAVTSIEGVLTLKTFISFDEFQYFTGVTTIPDAYFKDWTKLSSIVLPSSITSIGKEAFSGCSVLTTINIPNNVSVINESSFQNCISISSIVLPEEVTSINAMAFYGCTSLKQLNIPDKVSSIGSAAFQECSSLTSINLPEGILKISESLFSGCSGLTEITIPESVTQIRQGAFDRCCFESIVVKSKNKVFDSRNNCNAIIETSNNTLIRGCKNTIIPDGVSSIKDFAFSGCANLVSLSIPESVTSIGVGALMNCSGLVNVIIPESVSIIKDRTFCNCSSLSGIIIPESITTIESAAFSGCLSLTSISIPESISTIEKEVFKSCKGLVSIDIPEGLISIGNSAFSDCSSLTKITLPKSLNKIDVAAFIRCSNLASVTVEAENPPTGSSYMFDQCNKLHIYVPSASVETYKTADFWKKYASSIQAIQ